MPLMIHSHSCFSPQQVNALLQNLPETAMGYHLALPQTAALGARPQQLYWRKPETLALGRTLEGRFFWPEGEFRWQAYDAFRNGSRKTCLNVTLLSEKAQSTNFEHSQMIQTVSYLDKLEKTFFLWPQQSLTKSQNNPEEEAFVFSLLGQKGLAQAPRIEINARAYLLPETNNCYWRWLTMQTVQNDP